MAYNNDNKSNKSVVTGSYVEIIGGKYAGYYAYVFGFTATGQCRIDLDHGRKCRPSAIPTKNSKTRCLRKHVQVVDAPIFVESSSVVAVPDSELDLIARLVALKLKGDDDADLELERFVSNVRRLVN